MADSVGRSPQSLIAEAALEGKAERREDETQTGFVMRQVRAADLDAVCDNLDAWEAQHDVRFMALPVKALERLRDAWERLDDDAMRDVSLGMLRDLFGGIDGHLTAIDKALPR